MQKRGQAAMEFLMTYGWAILIVLVALATLFYLGVFDSDKAPATQDMPSGFLTSDTIITKNGVLVKIAAPFAQTAQLSAMKINGKDCIEDLDGTLMTEINKTTQSFVGCILGDDKILDNNAKIELEINYSTSGGVSHTTKGTISGRVEQGNITQIINTTTPPPADPPQLSCANLKTAGYWRLDEGAGTTTADSFGTNNGIINSSLWTAGKISNGLMFSGTNSYVGIPHTNSFAPRYNITLTTWAKFNTVGGVDKILVHKGSSYGIWYDWGGSSLDNNQVQFMFYDGSVWRICNSGFTPVPGRWYHFAATYDKNAAQCKFYLNGTLINTLTSYNQLISNDSNAFRIGGWPVTLRFNGTLDEVALFNNTLSATEIQKIYNASLAGNAYCT